MNTKKKFPLIVLLIVIYLIVANLWKQFGHFEAYSSLNSWVKYGIRYGVQIGLSVLGALLILRLTKQKDALLGVLGLNKNIGKGLLVAFIFTLPMLIGYFSIAPFNKDTTLLDVLFWSFISGFVEELLFRGLLFGLLYRVFKVGFLPSIIFVSILFALGHVYQGHDIYSVLGVTAITFTGSFIFGWLYIEWDNNLWVPIGTHIFMNLYWSLFDINATNALGGWGANLFRLMTIILLVYLTLRKIKIEGSRLKGKWASLNIA